MSICLPQQGSTNCSYYKKCQSLPLHTSLNFPSAISMSEGRREDTNLTDLYLSVQRRAKQGRHSSFSLLAHSPATFLIRAPQWAPLAIQLQLRSSTKCTSHRELDRSCEVIAGTKTTAGLWQASR